MSVSPILLEMLKRDRAMVAFGLAGVAILSWTYLIYMDWGMRHMDVGTEMVMMVAMMVPAASPVILLFAEINRRCNEQQARS